MTWGAVAGAGASLVGGLFSGRSAKKEADKQRQADAARDAAQQAALREAIKWKATGTTNRYGSSEQTVDPTTGQLTNVKWNMSPEMLERQNRMMSGAEEALPDDFDPAKATEAQYQLLKNQQAPGVERGYSGLLSNLLNKGTMGLKVGGTEGIGGSTAMAQSNPQLEAYFNTLAQQDSQNLTDAQFQVRRMMDSDIARSRGLMSEVDDIEGRGASSLERSIRLAESQRDIAMRAAGSSNVITNSNRTDNSGAGGSSVGSFFSGLGSNPQFGSTIAGMFRGNTDNNSVGVPSRANGGPTRPPGSNW